MRFTLNRILIGTLVLPMLLGALILWSLADRAEHSDRVPTAVVNLDKPVTQGEGKQPIYAGRLLAGELTSPTEQADTSLGWELTDSRDAEEGLEDGDYYAVLTIPEDFSKTLSGIQGTDPRRPASPCGATTPPARSSGQISKQVGDIATNKLGHTITATYIEGVLSQTGVLKKQLGEAADGADKLERRCDPSWATARAGWPTARTKLGNGAQTLASGLGSALQRSLPTLRRGRPARRRRQPARGRHRPARRRRRPGRLRRQRARRRPRQAPRPDQHVRRPGRPARQLDTQALAQGVHGLVELARGLQQACDRDPAFRQANPQLCTAPTRRCMPRAGPGGQQLQQLGSPGQLTDGIPQLVGAVNPAADGADRLASGTGQLANGVHRLENGAGQLSGGAARLATGADQLSAARTRRPRVRAASATALTRWPGARTRSVPEPTSSPAAPASSRAGCRRARTRSPAAVTRSSSRR